MGKEKRWLANVGHNDDTRNIFDMQPTIAQMWKDGIIQISLIVARKMIGDPTRVFQGGQRTPPTRLVDVHGTCTLVHSDGGM